MKFFKKHLRLFRWIPWILFAVWLCLLLLSSLLSGTARDTVTGLISVSLYVFAILSFLCILLSCAADMTALLREKQKGRLFRVFLCCFNLLLWVLLWKLNSAFTA